jgi:large subunit ribosomal protein L9
MEVLLLEDVEGLGFRGEVVRVRDGYARNFLIPRGLAKKATPSVLKAWKVEQEQKRRKIERAQEQARAVADRLEGTVVSFTLKMGEGGKAYGSIGAGDIARALQEMGFEVERKQIRLGSALRTAGEFPVQIRLMEGVFATITVRIEPEAVPHEEPEETPAEEPSTEPAPATEEHQETPMEGEDVEGQEETEEA